MLSFATLVVSCVDAVPRVFEELDTVVLVFRIDQTNASMSSRMMEWIGRCILLC